MPQTCLDLINNYAANLPGSDDPLKAEALSKVSALNVDAQLDVASFLEAELKASVTSNEPDYIEKQRQVYNQWVQDREAALRTQLAMYEKELRLEKLDQLKRDLAEKEERLFFFDNFEDMERHKNKKFAKWTKTFPPKSGIKVPRKETVKDDYVPPEIGVGRKQ